MEEKKELVSLQLCFICRKESTGILLQNRNMQKPKLESKTIGLDICDKCKKKYLTKGVLLIGMIEGEENYKGEKPKKPTGDLAVIKDSAFKKMFNAEIPKGKIAYCDNIIVSRIIQDNSEDKNKNETK